MRRTFKDERQVVKSILSRVRNTYEVSAAEVDFTERGCGSRWDAEFLDYEFEIISF